VILTADETGRFGQRFERALLRLVRTPRRARRYANALALSLPLFKREDGCIVEYLCREGLRGLADVAIIVHDLRHGESLKQQVMPVLHGVRANLSARRQAEAQGAHQLIEEDGHAVIDLHVSGRRYRPRGYLRPAPPDDLFAVDGNEFMEHDTSKRPIVCLN
jgi:hypothetical protein